MKRGPKPETPATKAARGTLRNDRTVAELLTGQVVPAAAAPVSPDYLSPAAREVWLENVGRVMLSGVGELDSDLFGRYCSTEALAREAFKSGEPPPAAYLTELRRMSELLGIAGPRVRTVGKPSPSGTLANPFARNGNGHRPRP